MTSQLWKCWYSVLDIWQKKNIRGNTGIFLEEGTNSFQSRVGREGRYAIIQNLCCLHNPTGMFPFIYFSVCSPVQLVDLGSYSFFKELASIV